MKKIILFAFLITSFFQTTFSQFVNDGYITNNLVGKYNQDSTSNFVMAFNEKLQEVRSKNFSKSTDLTSYLDFDPGNLVSLEKLQQLSQSNSNCKLSSRFIGGIIDLRNKINNGYESIGQIRDEIKRMALQSDLNNSEGTTLALVDLSLQQVVNLLNSEFAARGLIKQENYNNEYSGPSTDNGNSDLSSIYSIKLPRWLRCGLFVIISGIIGAGSGIVTGAQIGTFVGAAPGAVVGGVIGGIVGGIGGLIGGAIAGCD
ncbi:MAG: hypothetical protein SGI96_05485 [Bacteroidota bacterium]|nr:hypothetical protein [Bacteroidota bacterium]